MSKATRKRVAIIIPISEKRAEQFLWDAGLEDETERVFFITFQDESTALVILANDNEVKVNRNEV